MMLPVLIILTTFLLMELIAWITHKYVMHGLLWNLHKDHHQVGKSFFEKNDFFFIIFAIPSIFCYLTAPFYNDFRLYVGIGISIYGFAYFVIHDIVIHQRFKIFRNWNNRYIRAIRRAHKMHHKHQEKENGENFGMLIVPIKYWLDPTTNK